MAKPESESHAVVSRRRHRRGPSYLLARGGSWFFQIRLPVLLAPTRRHAPLRVKLFADSRRAAQRRALLLGAFATDAFERRLGRETARMNTNGRSGGFEEVVSFSDEEVDAFVETLRTLEAQLQDSTSMADVPLDALIGMKAIGQIVKIDREEKDPQGHPIVRRNAALLREDAVRRWQVATGAPMPDALQVLMDRLTELQDGQMRLMLNLQTKGVPETSTSQVVELVPPRGDNQGRAGGVDQIPLFSEIARQYLDIRKGAGAKGRSAKGVGTARFRLDIFLDVVGDRPVDQYLPIDLQRYVNELQYLPKAFGQRPTGRG